MSWLLRRVSYRVIKKINGYFYEYEQSTYRDHGKVRTISHYIGPASESAYRAYKKKAANRRGAKSKSAPASTKRSTSKRASGSIPLPDISSSKPGRRRLFKPLRYQFCRAMEKWRPRLNAHDHPITQSKVNFAKRGIYMKDVSRAERRLVCSLQLQGVNTDELPNVSIRYGQKLTHSKKVGSKDYVVTIPRGYFKYQDFKREVLKAQAKVALDAVESQQSERFRDLTLPLQESFSSSRKVLVKYLRLGSDRRSESLSLIHI